MQNLIVGIVGRKGRGKSRMARFLVEKLNRLLIFDPMAEHGDIVSETIDGLSLWELADSLKEEKSFRIAVASQEKVKEHSERFARAAYTVGKMAVILEELPLYSGATFMDEKMGMLFRMGRKRAVNVIWTGQRIAEVPRTVTALTDIFIIFHTTEPRDLKAFGERLYTGDMAEISALHGYEFFIRDVRKESGMATKDEDVRAQLGDQNG